MGQHTEEVEHEVDAANEQHASQERVDGKGEDEVATSIKPRAMASTSFKPPPGLILNQRVDGANPDVDGVLHVVDGRRQSGADKANLRHARVRSWRLAKQRKEVALQS